MKGGIRTNVDQAVSSACMSLLTDLGRRAARDMQRSQLARGLRQHEWFRGAPSQVVAGFAELLLVSRELRARIKADGVMRPDGTVHPAVEAFRKYKHTELGYLTAIAEMRRAEAEEPDDLVAQLARATDSETETVELEPTVAGKPDQT
jgi:cytochrome P450